MDKRISLFFSLLIAVVLLSACRQENPKTIAPGPMEVGILTIKQKPVNLAVELPGRTAAYRIAEVRPQVGGIIKKRLFTEGSEVKAGQLLYQIDPDTYQARFDSAKAALAKADALEHSARLKAERYRTLVQTKAVSDQDQVEMEANWKQAVADVAAAKAALNDSAEHAQAVLSVKDAQELLALQAGVLQPLAEKTAAYNRHLYDIASAASTDLGKAFEAKVADSQAKFAGLVDSASKNAPAGSETAVAMMKSAVAAANNAYESVQKAVKQASDVAEANLTTLANSAVDAAKTASNNAAATAKKR